MELYVCDMLIDSWIELANAFRANSLSHNPLTELLSSIIDAFDNTFVTMQILE